MKTKLAVFKNTIGNYDVFINNDCYEMNNNAMPNGLNMYCGDDIKQPDSNENYIHFTDYPEGLRRNILNRMSDYSD